MRKRMGLLGLLLAMQAYGADEFFYEEKSDVETVRLEESVIATTGFETSIRNTAANVTIVTSKEIEEKGYTTVEEALEAMPSVKISTAGFGSVIDVRGQGSDKAKENVKILVDGVSIVPLNKTHATMGLDSINLDNVASIEVIPGGGAVLYGTGTVGGVINIRTKTGAAMTPINSIDLRGSSHGRTRISASAGTMVGEDLLIQTNILSEQGNSHLDGTEDENLVGDISAKYRITDTQDITLKYEKSKEITRDPGVALSKEEYDQDRYQVGSGAYDYSKVEVDRDIISLTYNNQLNKKTKFSMVTSYQQSDQDGFSDYGDPEFGMINDVTESQIDVKPKLQFMYGEGSAFTFGYDYMYGKSDRDINGWRYSSGRPSQEQLREDQRISESHSVYALNTTKLNKLELTQGIRYNRTENTTKTAGYITSSRGVTDLTTPETTDDMDNMAYELAANYLYSDTGNTYVRWERGFNTPDPTDIYNNPSDTQISDGYDFGLSGVEEETYDSFEIGLRDFMFGTYISLTAFYTKTEDEIYTTGNSANWVSYNIDETERKGLEISLEQYFGKLTLTEGYTYLDAEITAGEDEGNELAGVAKHSIYLNAKYEFTPKLNTIVSVTYEDDVYAENSNEGEKDNDHIVTDIVANYKLKDGVRLYAGINNLFDEEYAERFDDDGYRAADERNYFAGVNYTF